MKTKTIKFDYKIILIISLVLFVALTTISTSNAATPLYVNDATGDDLWDGTTPTYTTGTTGPMKTIQTAINAVDPDGTVNVADGTYQEHLSIDKNVNLVGQSQDGTIIDGSNNGRPVTITSGTITLTNLTIQNGNTSERGGGIQNNGTLNITHCNIQQNYANLLGGGINNYGTLNIRNSNIRENQARLVGGGIRNYNILSITNTIIEKNNGSTGGGIYTSTNPLGPGTVTIENSVIQENLASHSGGAILNYNAILTIKNSQIKKNTANSGGGIYCDDQVPILGNVVIDNTLISDNAATDNAGGLMTYLPTIITNSIIRNNTAHYGGGILQYNHGNLTIINCLIENNAATDSIGGGMYSETFNDAFLTIINSKLTGNQAPRGGALYDYNEGITTITGCLFSGNSATLEGGAIYKYDDHDTIEVHFNRIVGNTAPIGANIYNFQNNNFNAENNWWGSNAGPIGIAEGTQFEHSPVDANPWLIMEFSANPTTITQGETSELVASFNRNSDGIMVGDENNHIPDGTPVTFTTNLGNVGSKSITVGTVNGIATAILRGDESAGEALTSAILDSQTLSTYVIINAATNNNTNNNTNTTTNNYTQVKAVSMQNTGIPLIALILALLMVIGGMVSSKKQ